MTIKKIVSVFLAFLLIFTFGFRKINVKADSETTAPETSVTEESDSVTNNYNEEVTGNKIIDFFLNMLLIFSEVIYEIMESLSSALTEEPTTLPTITSANEATTAEPTTAPEDEFSMCWPMEGETVIRAGYPAYSNGDPHYGIDIASSDGESYGKDIYAAESGTVIRAFNDGNWNGGFGNYVEIDHGNGIRTLYAHASVVFVTVGQTVEKGETIAEVGNTGNTTGSHLHFEVKEIGADGSITRVNPLKYVTQPE